ncbi:MAG: FAD-binding oxidoreductase [Candidatus Binatia bacterium]
MESNLRILGGRKEPRAASSRGGASAPLTELTGWGRYPRVQGRERLSENLERITEGAVLTRGLGRSYGDASLPPPGGRPVAGSRLADRVLVFDARTGVIRAEAGVALMELNRLSLPRGWFTPVTPGTHWVTLGGMVAADVHGKNHHVAGCFGEHVLALRMRLADGRIVECTDEVDRDLFRATLGGMGLTGHILEVTFQMTRVPAPWIWQESEQVADVDSALERLAAAGRDWPFTVCWNDLLARGARFGRGLVIKGRWAEPGEAPPRALRWRSAPSLPCSAPSWALQAWMVALGNHLNHWKHGSRVRTGVTHPEAFFYPLDVVREWNRVYGRRGFTQYQAVVPGAHGDPSHRRFLDALRRAGGRVFLCVIKDCGAEGRGVLSFPKPGVSYALDLPVQSDTQRLVDALNDVVAAEGGRIYLAKDAFTRPEHYRAMDGARCDTFEALRRRWDPQRRLKSALSIRLLGDTP